MPTQTSWILAECSHSQDQKSTESVNVLLIITHRGTEKKRMLWTSNYLPWFIVPLLFCPSILEWHWSSICFLYVSSNM